MKQVKSFSMKLPISFPSLIFGFTVHQKPENLSIDDVPGVKYNPLDFSYYMLAGNHVPDIVLPKIQHFDINDLSAEGTFMRFLSCLVQLDVMCCLS